MRVLGFDPSLTNFGWALHDTDAEGVARCIERGRFQTSSKQLFIDRYTDLRGHVTDLITRLGVTKMGCEYPIFNDLYSEGMYGLFLYTCEAMRDAKVDVVFFSPPQVKAHARTFLQRPRVGGKLWKMQKGDMVEAAKEDCGGVGQWNHNEADAYWVARSAGRFWSYLDGVVLDTELTPAERQQFARIHTYTRGKKAGKTVRSGIAYREDERFFRWSGEENGTEEKGTEGQEA
jgi:hypothetical protein